MLLPRACLGCGERVLDRALCEGCFADLPCNDVFCDCCARPLAVRTSVCGDCQTQPPAFGQLFAPLRYEYPLDRFIVAWKFRGEHVFAPVLVPLFVDGFDQSEFMPDILIPVPLHWMRLLRRGFNQAETLASRLGQARKLPVDVRALKRIRATQTQSTLPRAERYKNVADVFVAVPHRIAGKNVLLVDDVATSGATINAAAKALKRAGASSVNGLLLARA